MTAAHAQHGMLPAVTTKDGHASFDHIGPSIAINETPARTGTDIAVT